MWRGDGLGRLGVNDYLVVNVYLVVYVYPGVINESFNDFRRRTNGDAE